MMNVGLLNAIRNASVANAVLYVSKEEGGLLVQEGLIEVNMQMRDPNDASKVAARITESGVKMLDNTKSVEIATGFVRPPVVRGGNFGSGAPTKYPFETLEVGQHFFIADTEVGKGDAHKTLGSAVGSANQRYSEETGEYKTVTRAKRGKDHKTIKDADGSNITETVTVPVMRPLRKFVVNDVKGGHAYGGWVAPADGAVALRTM